MSAKALFYKAFQVVSEFVYAYCFHFNHQLYGFAVRLYFISSNNRKSSDLASLGRC
jgi:hypothetical protein